MKTQSHATYTAVVFALAFALQLPAYAQDGHTVRGMAATCANCHSADATAAGSIPLINGRDRNLLGQQLKDFKSGARPATVMHQLARGFTDGQLEQLATWFADAEKR